MAVAGKSTPTTAPSNGAGAERIVVTNPATGDVVGDVPNLGPADVGALVDRARAAQPAWAALPFGERGRLMRSLGAWSVRNRRRIAEAMMAEAGKTYDDAFLEISFMPMACNFWARQAQRYLRDERMWGRSPYLLGQRLVVRWEPLGVVGVIAPWNYPLVLGLGDAIPALMAGNSVVLKPSSITPLSSVLLAEGAREVGFPPDVLTVATGSGGTGTALVDSADMIMFTGSTETGRQIAERAGRRLIPVSLELGGKDPMIVLGDADLDHAADQAVLMGMLNSGQLCMSVERVYVEEPAYDQFVSNVVSRVRTLRHGVPGGPGTTDVGSLTGPGQAEIVERQVEDAIAKGARVLAGGRRRAENFFEPTVVVDVDTSMDLMTQETFGPVLPIVRVKDAEEALAHSNASEYGLNSSVFTRDLAKGERIARRLQAGAACVNAVAMNSVEMRVPFNGWKQSGMGGRHGAGGIRKYCKAQTILLGRAKPLWDPLVLPRSPRRTRLLEQLATLVYGRAR